MCVCVCDARLCFRHHHEVCLIVIITLIIACSFDFFSPASARHFLYPRFWLPKNILSVLRFFFRVSRVS